MLEPHVFMACVALRARAPLISRSASRAASANASILERYVFRGAEAREANVSVFAIGHGETAWSQWPAYRDHGHSADRERPAAYDEDAARRDPDLILTFLDISACSSEALAIAAHS